MNSLFNKIKASFRQDPATLIPKSSFALHEVSRLGLPSRPSVLAYDAAQGILAVGTHSGSIHLVGRNGIERHLDHPIAPTVLLASDSASTPDDGSGAANSDAAPTRRTADANRASNPGLAIDTSASQLPQSQSVDATSPLSPGLGSGVVIKQLAFKPGSPSLISLNGNDVLAILDLTDLSQPKVVVKLKIRVSCLDIVGGKWVVLGGMNGGVLVVDIATGSVSDYSIPPGIEYVEEDKKRSKGTPAQPPPPTPVLSVLTSPSEPFHILIGYESGTVLLWDLKSKSPLRRYSSSGPDQNLTALAWRHDATQFVAAYGDGQILVWGVKAKTGMPVKVPEREDDKGGVPQRRDPVYKIVWVAANGPGAGADESVLVLAGGNVEGEPNGLLVLEFASAKEKEYKAGKKCTVLKVTEDCGSAAGGIVDLCILPPPSRTAATGNRASDARVAEVSQQQQQLPSALSIVVATTTVVKAYALVAPLFPPLSLSPSFALSHLPPLTTFGFTGNLPDFSFREVTSLLDPQPVPPPRLDGGSIVGGIQPRDVLITGHNTKPHSVCVWKGGPSPTYLYRLLVGKHVQLTEISDISITEGGRWCIVVAGPHVVVYNLTTSVDLERRLRARRGSGGTTLAAADASAQAVAKGIPRRGSSLHTAEAVSAKATAEEGGTVERDDARPPTPPPKTPTSGEVDRMMADLDATLETIVGDTKEVASLVRESSRQSLKELPPAPSQQGAMSRSESGSISGPAAGAAVGGEESLDMLVVENKDDRVGLHVEVANGGGERVGWRAVAHVVHMHLVKACTLWEAAGILATGGDNGVLVLLDVRTGKTLYSTTFTEMELEAPEAGAHPPLGPASIEAVRFMEIPFGNDGSFRMRLIVATAKSSHYLLTITRDSDGKCAVSKAPYFRPQRMCGSPVFVDFCIVTPPPLTAGQTDPTSTGADTNPPTEAIVVSASRRSIRTYLEPTSTRLAKVDLANCVAGGCFTIGAGSAAPSGATSGETVIAVVEEGGSVTIFSPVSLTALYTMRIPGCGAGMDVFRVSGAKVAVWNEGAGVARAASGSEGAGGSLRVFGVDATKMGNTGEIRMYDRGKEAAWRMVKREKSREGDLDELFDGKRAEPIQQDPKISASASTFSQAKEALNERGQKLEALEHKFGALEESSKGFLDAIKEYNEREANKKWWQL